MYTIVYFNISNGEITFMNTENGKKNPATQLRLHEDKNENHTCGCFAVLVHLN